LLLFQEGNSCVFTLIIFSLIREIFIDKVRFLYRRYLMLPTPMKRKWVRYVVRLPKKEKRGDQEFLIPSSIIRRNFLVHFPCFVFCVQQMM
jgi:hypothetical protein